jgi:hypothetical protein
VVLPGVELKNVEVQLHGELLTIRAERKITQEKREVQYFEEEIAYGKFERVLPLPAGVVAEKLTALFANGVLEVIAPLAALALPRKVEIKPAVRFRAVSSCYQPLPFDRQRKGRRRCARSRPLMDSNGARPVRTRSELQIAADERHTALPKWC